MLKSVNVASFKPIVFLSEVKSELAKVVWPTREETIRLTGIVIVISLVVGLFIGALDYVLTMITRLAIK